MVSATITGFGEQKSKGMRLPVVSFETEEGNEVETKVQRIDQFLFLLNRPGQDDFTTVIYSVDEPKKARIYGYIHVVAGLFLFVPLLASLGLKLRSAVLLGQVSYVLVFGVIVFGGWVGLKLIQKYY